MMLKKGRNKRIGLLGVIFVALMLGPVLLLATPSVKAERQWYEPEYWFGEPEKGEGGTGLPEVAPIPTDETDPETYTTLHGGKLQTYKEEHADGTWHDSEYTTHKTDRDIEVVIVATEPGIWYIESGIASVYLEVPHTVIYQGNSYSGGATFIVPLSVGDRYVWRGTLMGHNTDFNMGVWAYDKAGHRSETESVFVRMQDIPNDPGYGDVESGRAPTQEERSINDCSSTEVGYFTVAGIKRYKDADGYYSCELANEDIPDLMKNELSPGWHEVIAFPGFGGFVAEPTHHAWTPRETAAQLDNYDSYSAEFSYLGTWRWHPREPGS